MRSPNHGVPGPPGQAKNRAALVAERRQAADGLADLGVQEVNFEAQRARVTVEAEPALYLSKLLSSNESEAVVRLILRVLVIDPLAAADARGHQADPLVHFVNKP